MADELEKRLESHGRAFEGLMSLIPAKLYYEQDNSDQWRKKKTTKEEKRAARKAKLDPRNIKSAKDVMDENERKRKREAGEDDDAQDLSDREGREQPLEGLKQSGKNKKQKVAGEHAPQSQIGGEVTQEQMQRNAERRRKKRARQAEKKQSAREKEKEKQKRRKETSKPLIKAAKAERRDGASEPSEPPVVEDQVQDEEDKDDSSVDLEEAAKTVASGQPTEQATLPIIDPASSSTINKSIEPTSSNLLTRLSPSDLSSNPDSTFSPALEQQAATSDSSVDDTIISNNATSDEPKQIVVQKAPAHSQESKEALRTRLEAKIAALRAARKADGEDGKPIRTRQELIEHRRTKELERKQQKKKQRELLNAAEAAQDEAAQRAKAEAELARLRGDTGSPIATASSSRAHSLDRPLSKSKLSLDGLAYSRLAFADGDQLHALGHASAPRKSSGAMDAKSALAKAEARAARLATLDAETRADIESKELWQRARQRVAGDKLRDDVSLLKKTLKKRERQKLKSEREWNERKDGVARSQEARQRKRETNLAKRRDDKGKKKGGGAAGGKKRTGAGSSEKQKAKRAKHKAFG